jgi:hypothetical protein
MEYYVVIGGQKQGPYDILSMIKKIKNGTVTAETLVSDNEKTAFRPATDFEEIKSLLKQEKADVQRSQHKVRLSLKNIMGEGIDLWARKVIQYTIGAGLILAIGFGVMNALKKIQILADFPTAVSYLVSVVVVTLFCIFFQYVLVSRRNQEPDVVEILKSAKKSFLKLFVFSAIFSLYTLPFELGMNAGLISLAVITFISCFLIFVPFLVQDENLSLKDAVRVSLDRTRTMGADNFGIVITLVAINLAVAIVPAIISPNLFVFGLFISLPLTVAALVHVYDQVFA